MNEEINRIKNRIKNKRQHGVLEQDEKPKINYFKNLLSRTLITIILVLLSVIYINSSDKNFLSYKDEVLTKNFSFATFNNWYQEHFGTIIPLEIKEDGASTVFSEDLTYTDIEKYNDGFKLTVNNNELIKNITSGIIVYIGEKENYGNVVIVQGIDGVDIWYGNITSSNLTLYDYVEEDTILGESKDDKIYVVLSKSGEYLDYEEYINQNKD